MNWNLRHLSFGQRVLAPPAIALVGFVGLIVFQAIATSRAGARLDELETKIFPATVTAFELERELREIQSQLEDSVNFETEDGLEAAREGSETFLEIVRVAEETGAIGADQATAIREEFAAYFEPAERATRSLVNLTSGPATYDALATAQDRFAALESTVESIRERQKSALAETVSALGSQQNLSFILGLVISLGVVVILAVSSWTLYRSVGRLGREVTGGVARINSASAEMMALMAQQDQASNQHAGAIEETRHTVASLVESAQSIAQQAEAVLDYARNTQSTNQEIAERNRELAERLEGITNILESVRDIANKSELLALNAALEGTKAGEAGRGFSLVAVQMQRLAESVMSNVENIKKLTREVRDASHRAVLSIEEGGRLANQTTESAERIQLVAQQQESATRQVTESMDDAALQVQQTAAGVTQSRSAMGSLAELAAELDRLLLELRLRESEELSARHA